MAYKPVGADENGQFPPRVEAALNSAYAPRPDNGGKPVGQGELAINVKDYGAKGDSTGFGSGTVDTAALQSALTAGAGRTVVIPKGMYRCTSGLTVPPNTTLELDKGAVLLLDTVATFQALLTIRSNTRISGGELRGQYTIAADDKQPWKVNGVLTNLSRIVGHRLINVIETMDQTEAGMNQNIIIENMRLTGSKDLAVLLRGRGRNFQIRNCIFANNCENLKIDNNFPNGDGLLENVSVIDNVFGYTYHVPTGVNAQLGGTVGPNEYKPGGNHIVTLGGVWDFKLERNKFEHCGRRSIEYYPLPLVGDITKTRDVQLKGIVVRGSIIENDFADADDRTFSCSMIDSTIDGNTIVDMDWSIEAGLHNTTFTNNKVYCLSALDFVTTLDSSVAAGTVGRDQSTFVTIADNYFEIGKAYQNSQPPAGVGYIARLQSSQGIVIKNNTARIFVSGSYPAFRARGAADTIITGNRIIYDARHVNGDGPSILTAHNSRGMKIVDNVFQTSKASAQGFVYAAIAVGSGCYDVNISNNTFDDRSTARLASSAMNLVHIGTGGHKLSDFARLTFSADGTTKSESALTGIASVPPASPTTGDLWFITQYPAPSGVWVNRPNQFATWSGSAWTYQTPAGAVWRPFADTAGLTENGFSGGFRPYAEVGGEAEFANWSQDGAVYLVGPVIGKLSIDSNRILLNAHNSLEPSRAYNLIAVGSTGGTVGAAIIEDVSITGQSALPSLASSAATPLSMFGFQRFALDRPANVAQMPPQIRSAGVRFTGKPAAIGEPLEYVGSPDGTAWLPVSSLGAVNYANIGALPAAAVALRGRSVMVHGAAGAADRLYVCRKNAADAYEWAPLDN